MMNIFIFDLQSVPTTSTLMMKREHEATRVIVTYVTTICQPNGTGSVELLETRCPPRV